jgi:hypothetical protein
MLLSQWLAINLRDLDSLKSSLTRMDEKTTLRGRKTKDAICKDGIEVAPQKELENYGLEVQASFSPIQIISKYLQT